jgi:ABC-type amino acid transport substrate-binding protein
VLAVAVDPHSHAATAIRPLEEAGVTVTKPTASDLAVAHGGFLDALAAGRIRHRGQGELTAAMGHLEQRRLGGASAPERRGALVDVARAVAAELAVWALATTPEPYDLMQSVW